MPPPYHPPVKRSVTISGHQTSIALEPLFWDMLRSVIKPEEVLIDTMVARINGNVRPGTMRVPDQES